MIRFLSDDDVDPLRPEDNSRDLAKLLLFLCGRDPRDMDRTRLDKIVTRFSGVIGDPLNAQTKINCEQLNELLLLAGELRIREPFFGCFVMDSWHGDTANERAVTIGELKEATKRFRGYAMLAFGNFRFAFRQLRNARTVKELCDALDPWAQATENLKQGLTTRTDPIAPLEEGASKIPRGDTWLLGYLMMTGLVSDLALVEVLRGKLKGEDVHAIVERLEKNDQAEVAALVEKYRSPSQAFIDEWKGRIEGLSQAAWGLYDKLWLNRERGRENTLRYLTWDHMDVYVATSMRHQWEFEDTHDFTEKVFAHDEIKGLNLRWFDPTQSYERAVTDKGLVEALMLKRARCTLYMAQESDTLGKDSELAATLAQGKPVIAFVRSVEGAEDLDAFSKELSARPLSFYRKRLYTLFAEDFFEPRTLDQVRQNLAYLGQDLDPGQEVADLAADLRDLVEALESERTFQIVGQEEDDLRKRLLESMPLAPRLMACIEAVAMDKRATTIKEYHPLSMQVHLESGVANGVLVVRSPKACAGLLAKMMTNSLGFHIKALYSDDGQRSGTYLIEEETGSRFRIVSYNEVLTNSFWNFYLAQQQAEGKINGTLK